MQLMEKRLMRVNVMYGNSSRETNELSFGFLKGMCAAKTNFVIWMVVYTFYVDSDFENNLLNRSLLSLQISETWMRKWLFAENIP